MKRPNLTLVTLRHKVPNKYAGEPDDLHFVPSSPLIERRTLNTKQESELSRACQALVSDVKNFGAKQAFAALYGKDREQTDRQVAKHDKHASFSFQGPKSPTALPNNASEDEAQKPHEKVEEVSRLPLELTFRRKSHQFQSFFDNPEEEALFGIRSKLEFRPKTSAAACIDYPGGETSSSSNRTSRTTPFTSAGITPGSTSKRFSQNLPDLTNETVDPVPALPIDDSLRLHGHSITHQLTLPTDNPSHEYRKDQRQPASGALQVREYSRRGSCQVVSDQPKSSRAGSLCSNAASSLQSQMCHPFSAIRQKFSRRGSNASGRTGYDHGEEYLINASQLQLEMLNRPLPPLPGLDTYVESQPRHIANLLFRPLAKAAKDQGSSIRIVNDDGTERLLTTEEEAHRREEMSRAVLEKMTTGSIGSGGASVTSPRNRMSQQTMHTSANISALDTTNESNLSRPLSSYSGQKFLTTQSPISDKKLPLRSKSTVQRKSASQNLLSDMPPLPSFAGKDTQQHQRATQPSWDTVSQDIGSGNPALATTPKSPFFKRVFGKKSAK